MLYRVDYAMAVLLAGFLAGAVFGGKLRNLASSRLARGYYMIVAIVLVLRTVAFAIGMLGGGGAGFSSWTARLFGDVLSILFGALFGLAVRRRDARDFLTDSSIFAALTMTLAFTFCVASLGKAFSLIPMTEFFTQSGYSVGFLKFIVIAETFGGLGLLLPWAVVPALIGLTVDMFGAVLTHIHNGDPLNDSTGAIGLLIRLVAVGALWSLRQQTDESPAGLRKSLLVVGGGTLACLLIAAAGSVAVRHLA
jgi:DoxX-like family